jgi:hypothetical protein
MEIAETGHEYAHGAAKQVAIEFRHEILAQRGILMITSHGSWYHPLNFISGRNQFLTNGEGNRNQFTAIFRQG